MNRVICPGCGVDVAVENNGCDECGWEGSGNGRVMSVSEYLAMPSYPDGQGLNEVCSLFLRRVAGYE